MITELILSTRREGRSVTNYDIEPTLIWRKSTRSDSGGCIEVALANGIVLLRDSKRRDGSILSIAPRAWTTLIAEVRGSAIDIAP
jgi:hypothetical protein